MPRKKSQAKRSGKSSKNSKSRKKWMNISNVLNVLNANVSKYWNSGSMSSSMSMVLLVATLCVCYKPSLIVTSTHYLSVMNPITLVFPSTLIHNGQPIHHMKGGSSNANIHHHSNVNNNNNGGVNQFCRIQSSPAPQFQRQVEAENKGNYVEFQGCRIVPTPDHGMQSGGVQLMSNEEKDINEIMAQLQSNAIIGDNILTINALKHTHHHNNNPSSKSSQSHSKKKSKKDKKKGKKKKKPRVRVKKIEVDDADTDRMRELDEMNEFGIDNSNAGDTQSAASAAAAKKKSKERHHTRKKEYKSKTKKSKMEEGNESGNGNGNMAWKPRRILNNEEGTMNPNAPIAKEKVSDHESSDNAEIDVNLMGMYERGFSTQLNKMHYTSDAVYEQIMEDISNNDISQNDIYDKYHIDFIPDESSFKLIPPPSIMDAGLDRDMSPPIAKHTHAINAFHRVDMKRIQSKMNANRNSKQAFRNFYALTRMQQKYLKETPPISDQHKKQQQRMDAYDTEDPRYDDDDEEEEEVDTMTEEDMDDESAMDTLRNMLGATPTDVLSVILNDDKLPQWLYESDTILDINCGIGDALVYLLSNFTTIRGICMVGTSGIKYKYAQLNIAQHGLLDRIDIVKRDAYDPYITSLYNASDIVYINWYNIDEEYVTYLVTKLMNDHSLRSSKPGRVILSYNKLLFDERVFKASYTLHFASGWKLQSAADREEQALVHDVSMFMYSIPFYLSKLSNLYVQNYQVFYGYHPIFKGLEFKFDLNAKDHNKNKNESNEDHMNGNASQIIKEQQPPSPPEEEEEEDEEEMEFEYEMEFRHKISSTMSQVYSDAEMEDADDVVSIITNTMNTLDEMGAIESIWDTMSSQLIFSSFANAIQEITKHDMSTDYSHVLMQMLNAINERNEVKQGGSGEGKEGSGNNEDDWEYLQHIMFSSKDRDGMDPPCGAYQYVSEQWHIQLNALLNEFYSLFFYHEIKDAVDVKMKSLFLPCK